MSSTSSLLPRGLPSPCATRRSRPTIIPPPVSSRSFGSAATCPFVSVWRRGLPTNLSSCPSEPGDKLPRRRGRHSSSSSGWCIHRGNITLYSNREQLPLISSRSLPYATFLFLPAPSLFAFAFQLFHPASPFALLPLSFAYQSLQIPHKKSQVMHSCQSN